MAVATLATNIVRFVIRGVNLKTTGGTRIVPLTLTSRYFVVQSIELNIITKVGTLTTAPIVSAGNNGATNNLVTGYAGITTGVDVSDVYSLTLVAPHTNAKTLAVDLDDGNSAGGGVFLNVDTAAAGSSTALTCDVHVFGYFVD